MAKNKQYFTFPTIRKMRRKLRRRANSFKCICTRQSITARIILRDGDSDYLKTHRWKNRII